MKLTGGSNESSNQFTLPIRRVRTELCRCNHRVPRHHGNIGTCVADSSRQPCRRRYARAGLLGRNPPARPSFSWPRPGVPRVVSSKRSLVRHSSTSIWNAGQSSCSLSVPSMSGRNVVHQRHLPFVQLRSKRDGLSMRTRSTSQALLDLRRCLSSMV